MKIKKNSAPLPGEQPLQLFVVRQILGCMTKNILNQCKLKIFIIFPPKTYINFSSYVPYYS